MIIVREYGSSIHGIQTESQSVGFPLPLTFYLLPEDVRDSLQVGKRGERGLRLSVKLFFHGALLP